jgi:hypothetical protein
MWRARAKWVRDAFALDGNTVAQVHASARIEVAPAGQRSQNGCGANGTEPRAGRLKSQPPAKLAAPIDGHEESAMISEMQIHVIARQMFEKHGAEAIYQAAQNAIACENKGDTEEAREWRHLEEAMKMMRGPHQP